MSPPPSAFRRLNSTYGKQNDLLSIFERCVTSGGGGGADPLIADLPADVRNEFIADHMDAQDATNTFIADAKDECEVT